MLSLLINEHKFKKYKVNYFNIWTMIKILMAMKARFKISV